MVFVAVNTANQGDEERGGVHLTCMVGKGSPEEGPLVLKLKDIVITGNGQAVWT